jgi:predicted DNA-binding transcriptional regulator YafY
MSSTAARLITLIMLLERRPNQKASELAQELGVSLRTVHRYFTMLDEMGIPLYSESGPYGGFSLVRGYKMPPLVLTPQEAVAVSLGTGLVAEMWGQLYREAARGALAKLENILPDEQRHEIAWARRSLVALGMHRADLTSLGETLDRLRRAVRERRRVQMDYQSRGQAELAGRECDPYALVYRWGWWYVVGFCHQRRAVRTFRVDRIAALSLLDQGFDIPAGFDIHTYLAQEETLQNSILVKLRFSPDMAPVAREDRLTWESMEELPDGGLIVTMLAWDVLWGVSTALAYGPGVTLLEPEEARQTVKEWALAISGNYS